MILVRPLFKQTLIVCPNILNLCGRNIPIIQRNTTGSTAILIDNHRSVQERRRRLSLFPILSYRSTQSGYHFPFSSDYRCCIMSTPAIKVNTKRTIASSTTDAGSTSSRGRVSINVPREGILMIISPAKTFDLTPINSVIENDYLIYTQPDGCCIDQTIAIARSMKRMTKAELTKALKLSPTLTDITKDYWCNYQIDVMNNLTTKQPLGSKPCIFMYSGAAYQGISVLECDVHTVLYMQDNLRILDALYGVLRPLDLIQPYRLEMDTKGIVLPNTDTPIKKLSSYWSEAITKRLIQDLQQASKSDSEESNELPILLNLASEEYTAAVDVEQIVQHCRYIKVIFYEDFKVIAVHAKRARGLMVRYISESNASTLDEVRQFNVDGYLYVPEKSDPKSTLVFNRSAGTTGKRKQLKEEGTVVGTVNASALSSGTNHTTTGRSKRAKQG